jgi:Protein of unknown function (DUF3014)
MDETRKILSQSILATIAAITAIAVAAGYWFWHSRHPDAPPPAPAPAVAEAPAPAKPASPYQYPIDDRDADHTLTLEQSDAKFLDALTHLGGWRASALRLFLPSDIIRHIVATVDALPREKVALAVLPTEPVPGTFRVDSSPRGLVISAANERRYAPYVEAFTAVDAAQAAALYRRFYPLFQQAYKELGYPQGYFNDRLVEVLDLLLEAPEPKPPIGVVAPNAMYHYGDPDLEGLAAGQKILVRVGPSHEKAIKARLREFRALITTG